MTVIATSSFPALGTSAVLLVTNVPRLGLARRILEEELAAIDEACSRFRPDSELSLLDRGHGCPTRASELFIEAIEVALNAARVTRGLVDPTVGRAIAAIGYDRDFEAIAKEEGVRLPVVAAGAGRWREIRLDRRARTVHVPSDVKLDLGATAKALAADRAARRVQQALGGGVLVSLGGDLSICGPAPRGGWLVQVTEDHAAASPTDGQAVRVMGVASRPPARWCAAGPRPKALGTTLSTRRVATPRTRIWRAVSAAAASCVHANVATTAAIVPGGGPAPGRLPQPRAARVAWSPRDGRASRVGGWPEEVRAEPSGSERAHAPTGT